MTERKKVSKTRRLASALIVLTFLLSLCPTILAKPPPPGYIPAGHKWGGAWTPNNLDGIRARIEVTDPEVPHTTQDFFCCWIGAASDDGQYWLQVGWDEDGWWYPEHEQKVYVEWGDPQLPGGWERYYHDEYPIEAGDWIWVKLTHSGYDWMAWIYWNGAWRKLETRTMPFTIAPRTYQNGELFITPDQYGKGYIWPFPDTHFQDVYVYRGRRTYRWTTMWTTYARADRPIYPSWINRYYNWYVYYTG